MKKILIAAAIALSSVTAAHAQHSEFSTAKGIRIGMTFTEVQEITGSMVTDHTAYLKAMRLPECSYEIDFEKVYANPICNPKKPAEGFYEIPYMDITIGGIGFAALGSDKLTSLFTTPKAEYMEDALVTFTKGYGPPKSFIRFKSSTKAGVGLDDFTAIWIVKDVVVTMNKHIDRDKGAISIESIEMVNAREAAARIEKAKDLADF